MEIAEDKTERRTRERIRHHFEVERELAGRLRNSEREGRPALFGELYDELFKRVPDHPRLTRRATEEDSRRAVAARMRLLRPFLSKGATLVEIAAGDCRLCYEASEVCGRVVGVDISDQREAGETEPGNFEMLLFDGFSCPLEDGIADVVFSYQLLEHLHPDDVRPHFELVRRLLRNGGVYVFDTPHRLSGPHDVSRFFGDELVCFHFQEWTYRGLTNRLTGEFGFKSVGYFRRGKLWRSAILRWCVTTAEWFVAKMPRPLRKRLAARLFQSVAMVAVK